MKAPYTVVINEGLTKAMMRGFRPEHPYNKTVKLSYSKLMEVFAYHPTGYKFMPTYQNGTWNGYISLAYYSKKLGALTFPCGLVPRVVKFFEQYQVPVVVKYSFEPPKIEGIVTELIPYPLRDYQLQAEKAALQLRRGVIKCPTGSGKTEIAAAIVKAINSDTIWLTHKKDLLYQTRDRLKAVLGIDAGILGDGVREIKKVTIVSVKTLFRHIDALRPWVNGCKVLFADEVHHATGKEWFKLMKDIPAVYRLGLTATLPGGEKMMMLEGVTGPVICEVKPSELYENNYLSKPYVLMVTSPTRKIKETANWSEVYDKGIVLNKKRNQLIVNIAKILCSNPQLRPVVISARHIKHIQILRKWLLETGLKFASLTGSHDAMQRKKTFSKVEASELDVMLVSSIFDEGVDIRNLRSLILASGGFSPINVLQRVGRGMRVANDKRAVLVVDLYDGNEYIKKHSTRRKTLYKREGYNVNVIKEDQINDTINALIKKGVFV